MRLFLIVGRDAPSCFGVSRRPVRLLNVAARYLNDRHRALQFVLETRSSI